MRRPDPRIIAAPLAIAVVVAGLIAASTAGAARSAAFSGRFHFKVATGKCSAVLCVRGVFEGRGGGAFNERITSLTPAGADQPGIYYGKGRIVIHTTSGLLPCAESFVFNAAKGGSDQEVGIICEFRSGTRGLVGASGHLQAFGSQPAGAKQGSGSYDGRLTRR